MKILSIETSCDETAISIVEAEGELDSPTFKVLGNALFSQVEIHKEYGGVYPMMAKREHAKNLPTLLNKVLIDSKVILEKISYDEKVWDEVKEITKREIGLFDGLKEILKENIKPEIDCIAVTSGPGLAPALWVGIVFAQALSKIWDMPVIAANHMEGHIASVIIENTDKREITFPALALLISGGHTEIVHIEKWGQYKLLGQTRDDAVGEAFDKVARMLGLPYPGGPEVSKLAESARQKNLERKAKFTRPMLHSNDLNFSFSGLKTAVLYYIRDNFDSAPSLEDKEIIAREFEDAVVDVLLFKTKKAIIESEVKTLIVAGGVIANKKIRESFGNLENEFEGFSVRTPTRELSTDNSLMIASAAYINILLNPDILNTPKNIIAEGNLKLN